MKVSGFTFIKNGISLGYPFIESVLSIDPLCDEIIINVGFNDPECTEDDGTYELIKKNFSGSKYKIIKNYWDPEIASSGEILSQQTNLALAECQGDICQYIQGDEALHQQDFQKIKQGYQELNQRDDLHGLVFKYIHFYGNTNVYRYTRTVYRREVRTIKNGCDIKSWKDAQGFRFGNGTKINAKLIDASVYHYGWARQQDVMDKKMKSFSKLYHGKDFELQNNFEYRRIWGLKPFEGTPPQTHLNWVKENTHPTDLLALKPSYRIRDWDIIVSDFVEWLTGYRIGEYKNYRLRK